MSPAAGDDFCSVCGDTPAYPGATFCGAECCAIHESKDEVRAAAKRQHRLLVARVLTNRSKESP